MNLKVPCHIIIQHVAREFEVPPSDILSRRRGEKILAARRAAYAVVSEMRKDIPLIVIARVFRGRDHSSLIRGIKEAQKQIAADEEFASKCAAVKDKAYAWKPPERFQIFSLEGRAA